MSKDFLMVSKQYNSGQRGERREIDSNRMTVELNDLYLNSKCGNFSSIYFFIKFSIDNYHSVLYLFIQINPNGYKYKPAILLYYNTILYNDAF